MLRSILRTSRWLARRQISIFSPSVLRRLPHLEIISNCEISPTATSKRLFTTISVDPPEHIEPAVFEQICNETLESLCEYFEELIDDAPNLKGADVTFSDGVLTVALGSNYGTYVINRQTPNKQIWLSSPCSGPKRYDLITENGGYWIYKHDRVTLHKQLQDEISKIVPISINFFKCAHSFIY